MILHRKQIFAWLTIIYLSLKTLSNGKRERKTRDKKKRAKSSIANISKRFAALYLDRIDIELFIISYKVFLCVSISLGLNKILGLGQLQH